MVGLGVDLLHDVLEFAILADDKADAVDAHVLPPHELLETPDPVLFRNAVVLVGQKVKVELLLFPELAEATDRVRADAKHYGIGLAELRSTVPHATGLHGAAWRHRLGIKVNNNIAFALEILEGNILAILIPELEGGCIVSNFRQRHKSGLTATNLTAKVPASFVIGYHSPHSLVERATNPLRELAGRKGLLQKCLVGFEDSAPKQRIKGVSG